MTKIKKGTELWGPNQLKSGIKFKKIPKFSGQLEAKLKKSETKYHFLKKMLKYGG